MAGCRLPTHSCSRSRKNWAGYGGGSAASEKGALSPQMPTFHMARPKAPPSPAATSMGPS